MKQIDRLFLDDSTLGVRGMQDELEEVGYRAGEKRIRRLIRKTALMPIYPKRNLSKCLHATYVHPYLLRNLKITRANQVWAIDISYVPLKRGYMYLTAIIDVYSRYIVGWQVSM
ncbi:MAG: DDE-type integrase/transposase/recombinase [Balneolaceae bacterium]